VKDTDLPAYYRSANVFVLPSINLGGQSEALGVVTLEAMASGTPVIATDVGGVSDIVVDEYNGFLVPEKSPQEISNKIIELFSNKDIMIKFRLNGIKTINEKFSWNSISEEFCDLFHTVV
jgi:glycosyltransferase involved in cell wall biosynthesis